MKDIREVLDDCAPDLMEMPGVQGVGEGLHEGEPCIVVLVSRLTTELEEKLPKEAGGYRVRIRATGEFRARE